MHGVAPLAWTRPDAAPARLSGRVGGNASPLGVRLTRALPRRAPPNGQWSERGLVPYVRVLADSATL
eukprot:3839127-Pyramimonas_sp.AAC.1